MAARESVTGVLLSSSGDAPEDPEETPSFYEKPEEEPVPSSNHQLVFFDLETTGLFKTDVIVQLAASASGEQFSRYIYPDVPMNPRASQVNGITISEGSVFLKGCLVDSTRRVQALSEFATWLKRVSGRQGVLLVAHNCFKFDAKYLMREVDLAGLQDRYASVVAGFADSLPMFKCLNPVLGSYKQESLVRFFLKKSYEAHNANADAELLQELVQQHGDVGMLRETSLPLAYFQV